MGCHFQVTTIAAVQFPLSMSDIEQVSKMHEHYLWHEAFAVTLHRALKLALASLLACRHWPAFRFSQKLHHAFTE